MLVNDKLKTSFAVFPSSTIPNFGFRDSRASENPAIPYRSGPTGLHFSPTPKEQNLVVRCKQETAPYLPGYGGESVSHNGQLIPMRALRHTPTHFTQIAKVD